MNLQENEKVNPFPFEIPVFKRRLPCDGTAGSCERAIEKPRSFRQALKALVATSKEQLEAEHKAHLVATAKVKFTAQLQDAIVSIQTAIDTGEQKLSREIFFPLEIWESVKTILQTVLCGEDLEMHDCIWVNRHVVEPIGKKSVPLIPMIECELASTFDFTSLEALANKGFDTRGLTHCPYFISFEYDRDDPNLLAYAEKEKK